MGVSLAEGSVDRGQTLLDVFEWIPDDVFQSAHDEVKEVERSNEFD